MALPLLNPTSLHLVPWSPDRHHAAIDVCAGLDVDRRQRDPRALPPTGVPDHPKLDRAATASGFGLADRARGQCLAASDSRRRPAANGVASPPTSMRRCPRSLRPEAMADPTSEALQELIEVVGRLRHPEEGCPWDLEQTHASLVPYVLEEAHEVADAIRHGDDDHLREELGDLLLQVVLHAQIAHEEQRFDLAQVARGISAKLIRRHPHVFGDAEADDSDAVRRTWDAIKEQERSAAGQTSSSPMSDRLAEKVRGMPALAGAMTISKKAAKAGFEWEDMAGVWAKVHEELDELKEAVASGDKNHAQEELGDVLFTLVNVARWCGIDPEEGLAGTNRRFLDRFSRVEAALDGNLQGRSIVELEAIWQDAKAAIRAENSAAQP